ncbi:hypothetical protein [Streptomyces sp. YIM 98790]|uniref:hypothetical protein n=1 Tax=Streptomyces sp. YIM 98790 TaxID=2689077 RepID=UPI0028BDA353|nr:hypothetical protein [Streptomyces sp. YIM 98790]
MTPDDPARIEDALARLQGAPGRPFRVRAYAEYHDAACDLTGDHLTPCDVERYLGKGRRLDLVAQFQAHSGNTSGYAAFVRHLVARYGPRTDLLQVTEEANVAGGHGLDGDFPQVHEALVAGVLAAKDEARRRGLARLRVGFNVATTEDGDPFFGVLGRLGGGRRWSEAVDYVGLDCFPDVWDHPVAPDGQPGDLSDAVVESVRWLRRELPAAGLPAGVPVVVAEHGWPTGPGRSPERQAEVLERVIRTLWDRRGDLDVVGYTLFALRDARSAGRDLFDQFGIVRDDYTPKPAFEVYRRLIAGADQAGSGHRGAVQVRQGGDGDGDGALPVPHRAR